MQEHVQLEVSLEIIMAEIANVMLKLGKIDGNNEEKNNLEERLKSLIDLQEDAYKGNRDAVLKILNREF